MGIETHRYLGPFVVFPRAMKVTKKEVIGCPTCRVRKLGSFCETCGTRIGSYTDDVASSVVNTAELEHSIASRMTAVRCCAGDVIKGHDVWIPNIKFLKRETDCNEVTEVQTFNSLAVNVEMNTFDDEFSFNLERLKEAYPAGSISTNWGFITWSS